MARTSFARPLINAISILIPNAIPTLISDYSTSVSSNHCAYSFNTNLDFNILSREPIATIDARLKASTFYLSSYPPLERPSNYRQHYPALF